MRGRVHVGAGVIGREGSHHGRHNGIGVGASWGKRGEETKGASTRSIEARFFHGGGGVHKEKKKEG